MLKDLKSANLIHLKGLLFLFLGLLSGGLLIAEVMSYKLALLLAICVWSFCRFYYYLFYVIEKYVDKRYKFSGLFSFILYLVKKPASIPSTMKVTPKE
jgi:hypothetical protein